MLTMVLVLEVRLVILLTWITPRIDIFRVPGCAMLISETIVIHIILITIVR